MWIRKSDLEIKNLLNQKEIKKKSLSRPIIFGTIFGLLFMILQYFGFRGGSRGFYIFSTQVGFSRGTLFFGLFGFILFFVLALYHQKRGLNFLSNENYVRCDNCKEISSLTIEKFCQCGGKLEPSEYFNWEEN